MEGLNAFCQSNLSVIYGLYGLAFFVTGLAVALESNRASKLALARALPFLAAFGLTHGLHEWIEMFLLLQPDTAPPPAAQVWTQAINIVLLAGSFLLLMAFAIRLMRLLEPETWNDWQLLPPALGLVYVGGITAYRLLVFRGDELAFWRFADITSRYLLGITASVLACWAMFIQRRAFAREGLGAIGRDLIGAALSLAWYAIFQAFVPPAPFFPASVLNSGTFENLIGLPVQLFRAAIVAVLAFFIVRVLRVFEIEYARRLDALNQERFQAQERAAHELSVLYETCRILGTTLDLNFLLSEAIHKIVTLIDPVRAGTVYLYDKPERALVAYASDRHPKALVPDDFNERARVLAQHALDTREVEYEAVPGRNSLLALPLLSGENPIGVLLLAHDGAFSNFAVLQTLARQLVIAIENARLYEQVQEKEVLRGQLLNRVVAAQEDERKRLARDLHDQTGQMLTGMGLGLSSLAQLLDQNPRLARQRVKDLEQMCTGAIDDLHRFVADLRPSLLDDLGLVAALRAIANQVEGRTGLSVQVQVSGNHRARVRSEIETILYRIAQEALNNTVRHARARASIIELEFLPDKIRLSIRDDGVGFSTAGVMKSHTGRRAWGLLGMQERVALVGGEFDLQSVPGEGTQLTVEIPLPRAAPPGPAAAAASAPSGGLA